MATSFAKMNWKYLPKAQALAGPPNGFCQVLSSRWWLIDPEKGLIFYWYKGYKGLGVPQCNRNLAIVNQLRGKLRPNIALEYIERVFVPIELSDWQ